MDYNIEELSTIVEERVPNFTDEQRTIYQTVMDAVLQGTELLVFIDARGGWEKPTCLTLLCTGGGHLVPPPKVLVYGAFQSDLRYPRCWHNSYMIKRIYFMKKK